MNSTNNFASMNDLPSELLVTIIKHLGLQDLIRCRLVSFPLPYFVQYLTMDKLFQLQLQHHFYAPSGLQTIHVVL